MLLLTCASLQPQATPCWPPGSRPGPKSPATSSDMRNLAHQSRRSCLAPGPAPPRLPLLVTVLSGGSSPETWILREGGGRPNYEMCWWLANRQRKLCSFIVVSSTREWSYKHTCPTNTFQCTDQNNHHIWTVQCLFPLSPQLLSFQGKKAHDSGTLPVTRAEDPLSLGLWSQLIWSDCRLALRSRRLNSLHCPENLRSEMHIPDTVAIPTSHSALDITHNRKRKATHKSKIVLCPPSLPRLGTWHWIHHLHHCCEEQSEEWTTGWQKKDR